MAAPRATQFIALRNLSRHGHQQSRRLSMTGPEYASRVLTKEPSSRASLSVVEDKKAPTTRTFNTSRSHKAPKDTSTLDFTFLPTSTTAPSDVAIEQIRVPILHHTIPSTRATQTISPPAGEETVVMKPTISSMSADAVYHPMAELADGHGMNIDFHAMADKVALGLRRMSVPVEEQASIMKQIWSDMVDDMLGAAGKKAVAVPS